MPVSAERYERHIFYFYSSSSPTGIAVDKNGLMYFVDATMIRKVDQNGIISTLIKTNDLTAVRPLSCDTSMDVSQVGVYSSYLSFCFSPLAVYWESWLPPTWPMAVKAKATSQLWFYMEEVFRLISAIWFILAATKAWYFVNDKRKWESIMVILIC